MTDKETSGPLIESLGFMAKAYRAAVQDPDAKLALFIPGWVADQYGREHVRERARSMFAADVVFSDELVGEGLLEVREQDSGDPAGQPEPDEVDPLGGDTEGSEPEADERD